MARLNTTFQQWLIDHAQSLDQSREFADDVATLLGQYDVFRQGVPVEWGGLGNDFYSAVETITEVASHSLTAAFGAWGQRNFIQNLLLSDNSYPREALLPDLISGKLSGGTGLSNAVKFLSQVEELSVTIREENGQLYLNGYLPWVTNIRPEGFAFIFAAGYENSDKAPIVIALPSNLAGISRGEDLSLLALQGSNTASIKFDNVELDPKWIISHDVKDYIAKVRPTFLGLQFGMAFGLAKRSLSEVEKTLDGNRSVLSSEYHEVARELERIEEALKAGLAQDGYFEQNPKTLFQLRIDIVDVVAKSVLLELQSGGGRNYLQPQGEAFSRRWKEAAFLPIVSPSAVQLRLVLNQ